MAQQPDHDQFINAASSGPTIRAQAPEPQPAPQQTSSQKSDAEYYADINELYAAIAKRYEDARTYEQDMRAFLETLYKAHGDNTRFYKSPEDSTKRDIPDMVYGLRVNSNSFKDDTIFGIRGGHGLIAVQPDKIQFIKDFINDKNPAAGKKEMTFRDAINMMMHASVNESMQHPNKIVIDNASPHERMLLIEAARRVSDFLPEGQKLHVSRKPIDAKFAPDAILQQAKFDQIFAGIANAVYAPTPAQPSAPINDTMEIVEGAKETQNTEPEKAATAPENAVPAEAATVDANSTAVAEEEVAAEPTAQEPEASVPEEAEAAASNVAHDIEPETAEVTPTDVAPVEATTDEIASTTEVEEDPEIDAIFDAIASMEQEILPEFAEEQDEHLQHNVDQNDHAEGNDYVSQYMHALTNAKTIADYLTAQEQTPEIIKDLADIENNIAFLNANMLQELKTSEPVSLPQIYNTYQTGNNGYFDQARILSAVRNEGHNTGLNDVLKSAYSSSVAGAIQNMAKDGITSLKLTGAGSTSINEFGLAQWMNHQFSDATSVQKTPTASLKASQKNSKDLDQSPKPAPTAP